MMCPKCGKEMRNGYLFSSKDGAFSFANEVPSALENAKNTEGFAYDMEQSDNGARIEQCQKWCNNNGIQ